MEPRWKERSEKTHRYHLAELEKSRDYRILFLGDSMMERWKTTGSEYWNNGSKSYKIFNGGVGGDRLENLLWRLSPTKNLPGLLTIIPFEEIYLMIGTNNLSRDSPEKIVDGLGVIIDTIYAQQDTLADGHLKHIIVYGLTARTDIPQSKIDQVNTLIQEYIRNNTSDRLEYRFFGNLVDTEDINFDDNVHLSKIGYSIWYDQIKPDLI